MCTGAATFSLQLLKWLSGATSIVYFRRPFLCQRRLLFVYPSARHRQSGSVQFSRFETIPFSVFEISYLADNLGPWASFGTRKRQKTMRLCSTRYNMAKQQSNLLDTRHLWSTYVKW